MFLQRTISLLIIEPTRITDTFFLKQLLCMIILIPPFLN